MIGEPISQQRLLQVSSIILSTEMNSSVQIGAGFFLNGTLTNNNSIVLLTDIGENNSALYCLTSNTLCCGGADSGLWKYPDGASVGENTALNIYFTRGPSSLGLHRRNSAMGPTGVYNCTIPSHTTLETLHLYIGLYDNDTIG
jgi:hypothetical protein